jgi:cell wall-associated NlpC family hydrolase
MKAGNRDKRLKWVRIGLALTLLLGMLFESACTQGGKGSSAKSAKGNNQLAQNQSKALVQGHVGKQGDDDGKIPLVMQAGVQYVKARQLVELLGFQSSWNSDSSTYRIGDKDVILELTMNSRLAKKANDQIKLASPPILIKQNAYIPVTALGDLFKQDMNFSVNGSQLKVFSQQQPINNLSMQSNEDNKSKDQYLNFTDDPDDPNKQKSQPSSARLKEITVMHDLMDEPSIPALMKKIDIDALVQESRRYLGVKYIFGAKAYPAAGGFDCSSFTQYLFGKYGVKLPRLSRDQAKQGELVGRNDLRVGDLVFFNVPGRFKSNNAVGHVGIYIGNNEMINANNQPKNGVQITNINRPYWKNVYLFAKRVAA